MAHPELKFALDELKRELAMRKAVYPRQVASGKLTPAVADRQTRRLQFAADTLSDLQDLLNTASLQSIRDLVQRLHQENLALGKAAR